MAKSDAKWTRNKDFNTLNTCFLEFECMDWADISRYARNITPKSLQIVKFDENYAQRVCLKFYPILKFTKNSSKIHLTSDLRKIKGFPRCCKMQIRHYDDTWKVYNSNNVKLPLVTMASLSYTTLLIYQYRKPVPY